MRLHTFYSPDESTLQAWRALIEADVSPDAFKGSGHARPDPEREFWSFSVYLTEAEQEDLALAQEQEQFATISTITW